MGTSITRSSPCQEPNITLTPSYAKLKAIGAGFNSALTETLMRNPGSNYMCVTQNSEMQDEMVAKFAHNFFPVCHGLKVNLRTGDLRVKGVYGTSYDAEYVDTKSGTRRQWRGWTPSTHGTYAGHWRQVASRLMLCSYSTRNANATLTGFLIGRVLDFLDNSHTVCEVNSMFPSDLGVGGAMQGGLVLVQLEPSPGAKLSDHMDVQACVTYMDPYNEQWSTQVGVKGIPPPFGKATGGVAAAAEKGIVLQEYVRSCRRTLADYHARHASSQWDKPKAEKCPQSSVDQKRLGREHKWVATQVARLQSLGGAAACRIDKVSTDYGKFVTSVEKTLVEKSA